MDGDSPAGAPELPLVRAARAAAGLLGLEEALAEPRTLDDLAMRLQVGSGRLAWLLDLLAAEGALARDGDRYGPAKALAAPPRTPGAGLIAAVLRRNTPLTPAETVGSLEAAALTCHEGIARVPPALVERLAELTGAGTLFDAGCGDGAIAEAVLRANPQARAILADVDLRLARRLFGRRVLGLPGNLHTLTPPRARVTLVSHVLHTMPAAQAQALLLRTASSLEPGGTLIVREIALAGDRSGPRFGLAFGLSMSLHSDGEVVAGDRLLGWLRDAGLTPSPPVPVGESVVIEATRALPSLPNLGGGAWPGDADVL